MKLPPNSQGDSGHGCFWQERFLGERPVTILDEPFANVDEHSKRLITQTLRRMKQRCILIVVSHEHSLQDTADYIIDVSAPASLMAVTSPWLIWQP